MVEICSRCDISGEKARLFDAIYEGKSAMLCERCAIIENITIIKKPDIGQLKASEKNIDVYERLKKLSGYKDQKDEEKIIREQKLRELDKNPHLQLPVKEQLNLIDHFHWEIMKNRRRKGLSHKQLAEAIGESEIAIDMLEKGKLAENSEILIKKLEQFFQISLKKISEAEAMAIRKQKNIRTKPVLLDEYGHELEHIPEPEVETEVPIYLQTAEVKGGETKDIPWYKKILGRKKEGQKQEIAQSIEESVVHQEENIEEDIPVFKSRYLEYRRRESMAKNLKNSKNQPSINLKDDEDLELDNVDISNVLIGDLRDIHKKRIEITKQERKEEKEKIISEKQTEDRKYLNSLNLEEKQRLIKARKEELRLMKEKESRNIDDALGGKELFER